MTKRQFDRRDFHKLTSAALGGLAAGSMLGCGGKSGGGAVAKPAGEETVLAKAEVHLCRGLNECKGQGKGGENSCRGQGSCATAKEHSCGGQNECKGLGGCGETVGANECKTHGGCHVPLMESAWETLRKKKEGEWGEKKLEVGKAPAKAE
ncbi:MAG TPA: hypothetical protein VGI40_22525 [Pirellulaceae bacterium]|jgi:hypothetical protein